MHLQSISTAPHGFWVARFSTNVMLLFESTVPFMHAIPYITSDAIYMLKFFSPLLFYGMEGSSAQCISLQTISAALLQLSSRSKNNQALQDGGYATVKSVQYFNLRARIRAMKPALQAVPVPQRLLRDQERRLAEPFPPAPPDDVGRTAHSFSASVPWFRA